MGQSREEIGEHTNREPLKEPEVCYRSILDKMSEGCKVIGFDWRYLYVNAAAARQERRDKEELLGRTMMEAHPGIQDTPLFATLRRCMDKHGSERMETELVFAPGSSGWFDLSIEPVPEGLFVLSIDITEHKRSEQEAYRRAERLAVINRVAHTASATLYLDDLLEMVYLEITPIFAPDAFFIALYDREAGELDFRLQVDEGLREPPERLPLTPGLTAFVLTEEKPLLIRNLLEERNHLPPIRLWGTEKAPASWLGVPMRSVKGVTGVISVQAYRPAAYGEEEEQLLSILADQLALAVENARLYQAEQRRAKEAAALSAIAQALNATRDLASVFQVVNQELPRVVDLDRLSLALFIEDRQYFTMVALAAQENAPLAPGETLPVGATTVFADVLDGRPHLTPDLSAELALPSDRALYEAGFKSRLNLPLRLGQTVLGALNLASFRLNAFSEEQLPLLTQVADAVAAAVQNAQLYEETLHRNRELALLNRVIAASAASRQIQPMLQIVCKELALAFGVAYVGAALLNDDGREAVLVGQYPPANPEQGWPSILGITVPLTGNPLYQTMLDHRIPLIIDDVRTDPRLESIQEMVRQVGTVSLLVVLLLVESEPVGLLGLGTSEAHPFSSEEVALAQRVADEVSGALTRTRLQETQQRLSTAVEQAAEAVLITDAQGNVVYANPSFEQSSGYSRAEIIGQHLDILRSNKHEVDFYRDMGRALALGQTWKGRMISRKRDNTLFTADATITPVRDRTGQVTNHVATLRDVTREVELEAQFRQAQKMEAVGRLAGGITHDFNNLLSVIHLSCGLMERRLQPEDPSWELVQRIRETTERASNLTRQLLTFSRQEVVQVQTLNLNTVIGDLSKLLPRILGEDVELVLALAEDLWSVAMDPTQVDQVVMNLSVNARDAMPEGGRLTIETANVVLDKAYAAQHIAAEPGDYVLLSITDTGVGMSDQVKAHLFEPFFTTKEQGKGTGLGLATVYGIVKQGGGQIGVYSEVGLGTTFRIYLPSAAMPRARMGRADLEGAEGSQAAEPVGVQQGIETILVVEDRNDLRLLAEQVLGMSGYQVMAAADGSQALKLSQEYKSPIHLLLTDLVMPDMSGTKLAEQLRLQRPEMQVLYMSGYADRPLVKQIVAEQGAAFLSKPFTVEELTQKVRDVLES